MTDFISEVRVMTEAGSIVVRRQLGRRLRRLREESGKTMKSVQGARLFSESKLARIEAGRTAVRVGDVWSLCRLYGATNEVTDALAALAEGTSNDGWWEDNTDVVPEWFSLYLGLESTASYLGSYHPEVVHGLLQTEDYARAVILTDGPKEPDVVDAQLKLRLDRQEAVLGRSDRRLEIILGPGTFALTIGSPEVMGAQQEQLVRLNSQEGLDIRVLPGGAGAHAGLSGPFMILDFDDPDDPSLVYLESLTGARYLEHPRQLMEYRRAFATLAERSVPIEEFLR